MELEDGNSTTEDLFQAAQRTTLPQFTDTFLANKIHFRCFTRHGEYTSARPGSLLNFRLYPACGVSLHISKDT